MRYCSFAIAQLYGVTMELSLTEHNPSMGIIGLKKTAFIKAIIADENENLWVARLTSTTGLFVGYFCTFSNDEYEHHLQNDKGTVRIFKTVEAAASFYSEIDSLSITYIYLGLV